MIVIYFVLTFENNSHLLEHRVHPLGSFFVGKENPGGKLFDAHPCLQHRLQQMSHQLLKNELSCSDIFSLIEEDEGWEQKGKV